MQPSFLIAQIIGPLYVVVAAAIMLNPDMFRRMVDEFFESAALTYLGGILALAFGLLILAFHAAWVTDWTAVITLIGWLGTIKGALLLIRPVALVRVSKAMMMGSAARMRVTGLGTLAFGLFLSAKGFDLF